MFNSELLLDQLLTACHTWNLDEVRSLIDTELNVDACDDDRITALQIAAANGNIGIVEYLLDMGANIEKDNQIGMTPLLHAARNGHINVVRILFQRGAKIDKLTYYGASAVTLAAAGGHIEVVQFLVNVKVSVNPQERRDTALCPTPIMAAVFRRHTHICVLLSQKGANLDDTITRMDNLSAIAIPIICNDRVMLATLLELHCNPTFRSLGNKKPHQIALDLKRDELIRLLKNTQNSSTESSYQEIDLRELIVDRDEISLRKVLRHRHVQNFPEGCTSLMYAVVLGDLNIVQIVREETNDVNVAEDVLGLTALMFAAIIGNNEVVVYLLNNGADISQVSHDRLNALDYAFCFGSLDGRTLCLMQRQLETGSPVASDKEFHFSGSLSGMAKIFHKIRLGSSTNSVELKEKPRCQTDYFERLLNNCTSGSFIKFRTVSDVLRSTDCDRVRETVDIFHKRLQKIRFIAEHCNLFGMSLLPIWFTTEDSYSSRLENQHFTTDSDANVELRGDNWFKKKEYFSLAQKNADLFGEIRLHRRDTVSNNNAEIKTRQTFESYEKKKTTSSASASGSEGRSFRRAVRSYSSFQQASLSGLRTIPTLRQRCSRENINTEYDGRTSPSRRSLNQYTFTLRNEKTPLRKSTSTSALDFYNKEATPNNSTRMVKKFTSSAYDASPTIQKRRKSGFILTDDVIWNKMRDAGLSKYIELFKQNEVDKGVFMILKEQDLKDLITDQRDRETILKVIENLWKLMGRKEMIV